MQFLAYKHTNRNQTVPNGEKKSLKKKNSTVQLGS